jgi:hypothetical protein
MQVGSAICFVNLTPIFPDERLSITKLARQLLIRRLLSMKSSRIRFYKTKATPVSIRHSGMNEADGPLALASMPNPAEIEAVSPEQVVTDIVVSTLLRVQQCSSAEVAAAAGRLLATLR